MTGTRLISFLWRLIFLALALVLLPIAGCEAWRHAWLQALSSTGAGALCFFCHWHARKYL